MTSGSRQLLVALLLAAVASWWLARSDNGEVAAPDLRRVAQPGYYLREAKLEQTDDTGRVYLRIATARADQDAATQEIALRPVQVDYLPAGSAPWKLTASTGRLPPGARTVSLADDVVLTGNPVARRPPVVVRTSLLTLDTVTSVATTSAPVRMELGPNVLTGTGMRADLEHQTLALESSVRGRYVR